MGLLACLRPALGRLRVATHGKPSGGDQLLSRFVQCSAQLLAGQRIYDLPVAGRKQP